MRYNVVLIFTFIIFNLSAEAQLDFCDSLALKRQIYKLKVKHDKDSLPKFDLYMKDRLYGFSYNTTYDNNISVGVGYFLYSDAISAYRKLPSLSYETNFNYHFDGYFIHNFAIKWPFLICPTLNFTSCTNFNKTSFFIKPGIGIDGWFVNFNYNFNYTIVDNLNLTAKHSISLYFRPSILNNLFRTNKILKDPEFNTISQWDKYKSRKLK